jgi:hypothetical protein
MKKIATLEEVYGVVLGRAWRELPVEERQLVSTAVGVIRERLIIKDEE